MLQGHYLVSQEGKNRAGVWKRETMNPYGQLTRL